MSTAPVYVIDPVFAPVDLDHQLERVAGGNETEVYITDDRSFVVKLKSDLGGDARAALRYAVEMRAAAERFERLLGPRHSIPSWFLVSCDRDGHAQVLAVQPFLEQARPLFKVDWAALSEEERRGVAQQLRNVIDLALRFHRQTGRMPDLYGRSSDDHEQRRRNNSLSELPRRMWSFLVERNLLRSHNLLLTASPEGPDRPGRRVVLVDYDTVRRSFGYRLLYFAVRRMLFWRDRWMIRRLERMNSRLT
jgi:hypothetical protein